MGPSMSDFARHVDGVELGCSAIPNEGEVPTSARGVGYGPENEGPTSL
jgi:hypothetical protein